MDDTTPNAALIRVIVQQISELNIDNINEAVIPKIITMIITHINNSNCDKANFSQEEFIKNINNCNRMSKNEFIIFLENILSCIFIKKNETIDHQSVAYKECLTDEASHSEIMLPSYMVAGAVGGGDGNSSGGLGVVSIPTNEDLAEADQINMDGAGRIDEEECEIVDGNVLADVERISSMLLNSESEVNVNWNFD